MKKTAPKISVFIVEDHPVTREGMELLINKQPDMRVVGSAASYGEAVAKIPKSRADVAVLDLALPGAGGIDVIRTLRKTGSSVKSIVFSLHDEMLYAERALRAGANGYLMKEAPSRELVKAIRKVVSGKFAVSEDVAGQMILRATSGQAVKHRGLGTLSDRELEIFNRIGAGHRAADIAADLCVSVKTVESHKARIKRKLGLRTTSELSRVAITAAVKSV